MSAADFGAVLRVLRGEPIGVSPEGAKMQHIVFSSSVDVTVGTEQLLICLGCGCSAPTTA